MDDATDILMDFLECAVHTVLYSRKIYPNNIFEQRMKYGVSVRQCMHPDVCTYVRRVLTSCRPLLEQGVMDRLVITTLDESLNKNSKNSSSSSSSSNNGNNSGNNSSNNSYPTASSLQQNRIIDQISLSTRVHRRNTDYTEHENSSNFYYLEDNLRSCILKLTLLDISMKTLPDDATWTLMVTTGDHSNQSQVDGLQSMLLSGDWVVDNNLFPEKVAASKVPKKAGNGGIFPFSKSDLSDTEASQEPSQRDGAQKQPSLLPIKSFENDLFNLNIFAHSFR